MGRPPKFALISDAILNTTWVIVSIDESRDAL
jgi:hypothetical protein